ncbi:uncharacterized protein LOC116767690 [Danaus plexippus]|uniref:Uncharacterized protein n=1 Tax=Danaus plexippus plexippus TaxID=278856 RepID=A0A212F941_DANPL|nr:uncharacterized protein LOC116767690 [Danaus plexippus]OWR50266.1 hypothetical protein KGM_213044 [Danaus plexippus plexippus]
MDSNSNSCELSWTKIEVDMDNDNQVKREPRWHWTQENTLKLIEAFEKDCKELWDTKHPLNRDKNARHAKHEYLANMFETTSDEISRKLHNLRTQFNNELRKIKRKQAGGEGERGNSGWEYFDSLAFLMREPLVDPLDTTVEGVNLALAEFQADEEVEFGLVRARVTGSPVVRKPVQRVAASAPPPLPPSAHPMMWPEQPKPRIRPGINADECQIFGDFVASELRTLRSDASRKRLKRIIQKAILQIGEEEDVNIISG